jgi:hypothetical protein
MDLSPSHLRTRVMRPAPALNPPVPDQSFLEVILPEQALRMLRVLVIPRFNPSGELVREAIIALQ